MYPPQQFKQTKQSIEFSKGQIMDTCSRHDAVSADLIPKFSMEGYSEPIDATFKALGIK